MGGEGLTYHKVFGYLPEHGSLDERMDAAIENLPLSLILKYDLPQLLSVEVAIFK